MPPGSLAGAPPRRARGGGLVGGPDGCCLRCSSCPLGPSWAARQVRSEVTGTAAPRQLPGAGAVAASRRGLGHAGQPAEATREDRRRRWRHDPGLVHLSRSAASKLTILLLRSSIG